MLIPTSAPTGRNGPSNGECGRPAGPRETCRPIRRLLTGNCGQHLLENQSPLPSGALAGAPKMVSQGTSRRLEQSCYYYPQKMSAPRRSQRERARFFSSVRIHPPGAPPRPGDSWGQPHRLISWCSFPLPPPPLSSLTHACFLPSFACMPLCMRACGFLRPVTCHQCACRHSCCMCVCVCACEGRRHDTNMRHERRKREEEA